MTLSGIRDLLRQALRSEAASRRVSTLLSLLPKDARTRKAALSAAVVGLLYLLLIPNLLIGRSAGRDLDTAKVKNRDMVQLSREYTALKERVDAVERRGALYRGGGVIQVMDEMISGLGLKAKLKGIKGLGSRETKAGLVGEGAEVSIEGLSMNELVNLLHRVDTAPMMLSAGTTAIRRSFQDQRRVDVTLTVTLFTARPSP